MMLRHDRESGVESQRSRMCGVVAHMVFGVAVAALIAVVFGYFVMLLWNGVLPHVTAARSISYWQAVGLLLLTRILVDGLKGHGSCHRPRPSVRQAVLARIRPVVEGNRQTIV